jgi:hypothetical protein
MLSEREKAEKRIVENIKKIFDICLNKTKDKEIVYMLGGKTYTSKPKNDAK